MKLAAFGPELLPERQRRNWSGTQRNHSRQLENEALTGRGSSNLLVSRRCNLELACQEKNNSQ
jgi:hypothetical protein